MARRGFVDQIRDAVRDSGLTQYAVAAQSGVDPASLSRFVRGGGLSMPSLEAVASVLGLTVVVKGAEVEPR